MSPSQRHAGSGRTVLVTGASAGIGEAFARLFAARGWNLVLTARRQERLDSLRDELGRQHGIRAESIAADLADPATPEWIVEELHRRGIQVDALVNNAGYGVPGQLLASSWRTHEAFLRVMTIAVVEMTYRVLPPMLERGYGRILNVASLAGLVPPSAGHTLYAAAKAFVIRFSQALAAEVAPRGVHVTALCPGFTLSEFHDVTGTRQLVNRLPQWMWMDSDTVAQRGYQAVMSGRVVYVPGGVNRAMAGIAKLLPERLSLAAVRRNAARFRKT